MKKTTLGDQQNLRYVKWGRRCTFCTVASNKDDNSCAQAHSHSHQKLDKSLFYRSNATKHQTRTLNQTLKWSWKGIFTGLDTLLRIERYRQPVLTTQNEPLQAKSRHNVACLLGLDTTENFQLDRTKLLASTCSCANITIFSPQPSKNGEPVDYGVHLRLYRPTIFIYHRESYIPYWNLSSAHLQCVRWNLKFTTTHHITSEIGNWCPSVKACVHMSHWKRAAMGQNVGRICHGQLLLCCDMT